jgi:hypothetical protein
MTAVKIIMSIFGAIKVIVITASPSIEKDSGRPIRGAEGSANLSALQWLPERLRSRPRGSRHCAIDISSYDSILFPSNLSKKPEVRDNALSAFQPGLSQDV